MMNMIITIYEQKNHLWMDVTPWCYKWVGGWDGMGQMDLWVRYRAPKGGVAKRESELIC